MSNSMDDMVQKSDGSTCRVIDLCPGDFIKSAKPGFCHLFVGKIDYVADNRNITYVQVRSMSFPDKLMFKIHTGQGKQITASFDHKFKVMRLSDLNNYEMKPLCQVLDVDSWNENCHNEMRQYYRLVTQDGIQNIEYDRVQPQGMLRTVDIQVQGGQFFVNGILVSDSK